MSELGPVYGVELIDTLPMNYGQTKGMLQAMPSAADLKSTMGKCTRVAAGYEVLLNHWREQADEIEQFRAERNSRPKPKALKVAVCEYLLEVNRDMEGPFIPPTAIDWIGDGIVGAVATCFQKNREQAEAARTEQ